ncbi:MAG TPA: quinolinate phosphoribosyl transferase [Verrucomicrobiae bacterium]|nr:quinolinate phosphoribosyl transferase [Verrucomicrobiae bacterium]
MTPPGPGRRERLDPTVFRLPVAKIRQGYYSDAYFNHTLTVLARDRYHPQVVMQVFQRRRAVLGGIDEAIALLKLGSRRWAGLTVRALYDGDEIEPWEPVLTIEGDYGLFAHLETVVLGALTRRTRVATNVRRVVEAARGKPIIFFPARFDHHAVQTGDGWAAHVAGAIGVSTDAQASWWGARGIGTVPHALIAAYGGDTVRAAVTFATHVDPDVQITVLVDFDNDCVGTAVAVARALGPRLWGVRLDTSQHMVDRSMLPLMGEVPPGGVTPELCRMVRAALDEAGHPSVQIVASGGFTADRIAAFEAAGVPVDAYGVGSAFFTGRFDFTADIVRVDGRPCAKAGRHEHPSQRLEPVE